MPNSAPPINVLVVDDTITYRTILKNIVEELPRAHVIATANNGRMALTRMEESPADLVLLDIEMPEMDGLETLKHLRERYPDTGVVMVSGMNRSSADVTIRALETGALDFIPKPDSDSLKQSADELREALSRVLTQFESQHLKKRLTSRSAQRQTVTGKGMALTESKGITASPKSPVSKLKSGQVEVLAIGASTGGPSALAELLPKLPGDLGVPVLIVQHMPPVFTASMATSLDRKCALTVKEAEDQEPVQANTVYIAPGGQHMTVRRTVQGKVVIRLSDAEPEHSCRPAVDVLFRSISETYRQNILSVMLTGMGSDGALGVKALKQHGGCHSIIQSRSSCVVFGMPGSVEKMNLADETLDLADIAARVTTLIQAGIQPAGRS